jgi:hypothetical protein
VKPRPSSSAGGAFAPINAGAKPNSTPVIKDTHTANPSTSIDGLALIGTCSSPGNASISNIRATPKETASAAAPPIPDSNKLSVSSCRTILVRIAPSAVRTLISVFRCIPRTSKSVAMLAHAIIRTSPAIHTSSFRFEA